MHELGCFQLLLSITAQKRWNVSEMDITAAFFQGQGLHRVVYVRPPKEEGDSKVLWRLAGSVLGLADSGRLWYLTSNTALVNDFGLTQSRYNPSPYFQKDKSGFVSLIVVCQVYNYIYSGLGAIMHIFQDYLKSVFYVGKHESRNFAVYGSELTQDDDGVIHLIPDEKLQRLCPIEIEDQRKRNGSMPASSKEIFQYQSRIGHVTFMARVTQPLMAYFASHMAAKLSHLQKHHLKALNAIIKYLRSIRPEICFRPGSQDLKCVLDIYIDAMDHI